MTSHLQHLLDRVHEAGASLSVNGDKLRVSTTAPMAPELVGELRQNKPAILDHLRGDADNGARPPRLVVAVEVPPGGPGEWVQGVARLLAMPHPRAWPEARWATLHHDALAFLRQHGAEAARLAWDMLDVFGIHPKKPLARYDSMGLVPMLGGRAVIEIGETWAVIESDRGQRMTWRKHPAPAERILIWESAT